MSHLLFSCTPSFHRSPDRIARRALGRIGTSYIRLGDYDNGIKYLNKSLTEHRTPDILQKLKDAEKEKAEKDRLAYVDPAKADEAREEGNKAFKVSWELPSFYPSFPSRSSLQTFLPSPVRLPSHFPLASSPPRATFPDPTNPRSPPSQAGDFATAVQHYTESIKRNPADARGYTNRAAAYTKLLALPEALRDADKAIEVQPDFGESGVIAFLLLLSVLPRSLTLDVGAASAPIENVERLRGRAANATG